MADLSDHYSHRGAPDENEPGYDERAELLHGPTGAEEAPPTGEEIHMPDPSLIPILNAVGVTLMLLGVTIHIALLVVGTVLTVVTTVLWVRDTRREIASLPAEHEHH